MSKKNRRSGGKIESGNKVSQTPLNPHRAKRDPSKTIEMQYKYLRSLEISSYIILMILALVALELPHPFGQIIQISVLFLLVMAELSIKSKKKKLLESMEKNESRETENQSQTQ